jgi:hypothetical protein
VNAKAKAACKLRATEGVVEVAAACGRGRWEKRNGGNDERKIRQSSIEFEEDPIDCREFCE